MNACVKYQTTPTQPITVTFDPNNSANSCMNDIGSAVNITVTTSDVTCGSVGYVESKSSGDCYFHQGYWNLAFNTSGPSVKSGTASTYWVYHSVKDDEIYFDGTPPAGTNICGSAEICSSSTFYWGSGTPTVWVSTYQSERGWRLTHHPTIQIIFEPDQIKMDPIPGEHLSQIVMA